MSAVATKTLLCMSPSTAAPAGQTFDTVADTFVQALGAPATAGAALSADATVAQAVGVTDVLPSFAQLSIDEIGEALSGTAQQIVAKLGALPNDAVYLTVDIGDGNGDEKVWPAGASQSIAAGADTSASYSRPFVDGPDSVTIKICSAVSKAQVIATYVLDFEKAAGQQWILFPNHDEAALYALDVMAFPPDDQ